MNLSLNWLSQFVDLKGLNENEIIDKVIKAGFEVESVTRLGEGSNLTVGRVIECHDHPDSDHLHVTKVDIGSEVLDIVCGAPNCREGLKVIVAKVGAILPGGEIKNGVIRGVASNGMLCSLLELGISKDILDENSPSLTGIEELDDSFEIGDDEVLKHLGYGDILLDLSIYANRPDCLAMFSFAKEMAAILDSECKVPELVNSDNVGTATNFKVNSTSSNCPHFLAKVCNNVALGPSPKWMKDILRSNGIKSINNLVDISNLVMLETGQPMHFYDLRSNPNREITVVDDYEGDYVALDGNTYKIQKGDLMITSNGQPIGIAGIMGGDNTNIHDDTSSILIESAAFDASQIRRTFNRLGLQTEAAMRFAKGLDPLAQQKAMDRAVELLTLYASASEFETTAIYGSDNYHKVEVKETLNHLNKVLGKTFTMDEVVNILRRLDFNPEVNGEEVICHIPSYRIDINIAEDLVEEVIRLSGFDDLPSTLPLMPQTIGKLSTRQAMRRQIEEYLTNAGLNEILTYTLVDEKMINDEIHPLGESIALLSPLSDAHKYVRTGLFSSMLQTFEYNVDHKNENINLFEISTIYAAENKTEERLAVLLSGKLQSSSVKHLDVKADFYVLKGLILALLERMGFGKGRIQIAESEEIKALHPYQTAAIKLGRDTIGVLGTIHPRIIKENKLVPAYYLELNLEPLIAATPSKIKAQEINRFPSMQRDISLLVKEDVKACDLIKVIEKTGGKLVSNVKVFDIYKGDRIPEGYISIALNIIYESKEKTLKLEDVNPVHEKILAKLNSEYEANLRL